MPESIENKIFDSSTLLLLRDSGNEPEVLMLQKSSKINYGGSWVFPGGVTDPEDLSAFPSLSGEELRHAAAARTVIRETEEETGLEINPEQIRPFSNWLTPKLKIKRYNTLFFVAELNGELAKQAIKIDESEIVAHQWIRPVDALLAQAKNEMSLTGPSHVTLKLIEKCRSSQDAILKLTENGFSDYKPRGLKISSGVVTLYNGDVLYDSGELDVGAFEATSGPQHRLLMHADQPWEYIDTRSDKI